MKRTETRCRLNYEISHTHWVDNYYGMCIRDSMPLQYGHYHYDDGVSGSFLDLLFFDEVCDGKDDFVYGLDELFHNCSSFMYLKALRCPRDKKMVYYESIISKYIECPSSFDDALIMYYGKPLAGNCTVKGLALLCLQPTHIPNRILTKYL